MMKKIFACILISVLCSAVFAQTEEELKEQNKEFMKQYKKAHKLKYMSIKKEADGFWYYEIYGKKWIKGIVSQKGEVIVPLQYDLIDYFPAMQEGYSTYEFGDEIKSLWHQNSEPTFVAYTSGNRKKGILSCYSIYKIDGTPLLSNNEVKMFFEHHPGYFEITILDKTTGKDISGLYTWGGKELLPIKYDMIQLDGKICKYSQKLGNTLLNGTWMHGALMLDGSLPAVPCQFAGVEHDSINNNWLVRNKETYKMETFDPSKHYTSDMKDEGVRLYWSGKYDEAIKYYSKEGIAKPWAKYYTGAAMLEKADKQYLNISAFTEIAKNGKMDEVSNGIKNRLLFTDLNPDIELMKQLYTSGHSILNEYLAQDSRFEEEAKRKLVIDLDTRLRWIAEMEPQFTLYWAEYQKQNAAIEAHQAELKRQQQERENAIYLAIARGFLNGLSNAISGSSNSGSSYSSNSYSSGGSYRSTTNTSSSSQSNELSAGVQDRIRQLERNIKNETTYLENAQKRYESNPTAVAKREIETHKRAIEGYKKQIEDLKNGR